MRDFNSIKVQLEQIERNPYSLKQKFQFHKGTIRTTNTGKFYIKDTYFNSIKVQLEQMCFNLRLKVNIIFQFHKGTIRTVGEIDPTLHFCISIP